MMAPHTPKLRTPRLVLRNARTHDIPALVAGLNNLNVSRTTGRIPFPYTTSDAEEFVSMGEGVATWLAFSAADNHLVGGVSCLPDPAPGEAELGYWVAEADWGQGYGREMAETVTAWFFGAGNGTRLVAKFANGNTGSQRILEGLGFIKTGDVNCESRATGETSAATGLHLPRELWFERKDRHS